MRQSFGTPAQVAAYRALLERWLWSTPGRDTRELDEAQLRDNRLFAAIEVLGLAAVPPAGPTESAPDGTYHRAGCIALAAPGWWARISSEAVEDEREQLVWHLHLVEEVLGDLVRVWRVAGLAIDPARERAGHVLYNLDELSPKLVTWNELEHEREWLR